uniref:Uncharacterized protein n=1 Tax=Equus caballus TaxID=9796 RepID=A0A9L0RQ37_HORSE
MRGCDKAIRYIGCAIQHFLSMALDGIECLPLVFMVCAHFVTVCKLLHYMVIMNQQISLGLVSLSCGSGVANYLFMSPMTLWLSCCGYHKFAYFLFNMSTLIWIACANIATLKSIDFILALGIVLSSLVIVLISYDYIVRFILNIQSSSKRHKGFNTRGSHFTFWSHFFMGTSYIRECNLETALPRARKRSSPCSTATSCYS